MINQETKEKILEAARIEEVIGEFVVLRKRGSNLLGVCPFHNERTPSFTVSPAKGFFKCFGCGKAGDSVTFIMEHEHLSFPEALRYLANKYNIEIAEEAPSAEMIEAQSNRESLFAMTEFAKNFFRDYLWNNEEGIAIGLSYFRERGFTDEIIRRFELGFAPDKWDGLTKAALDNGFKLEFLEKTGLTIINEQKQYDRFRGRVVFPISSLTGRVIAFGARILKTDPKSPKYLNSPETEIYHKSRSLYGISLAKKDIIAKDVCYLVEGYTDVVSLHQAGIENVVASSGTSLTVEQIRLIGRYTKNITVLYDGDAAGIKASIRGIDLILEEGMNVRVVLFPQGEDPDSFSRKVSTVELLEFLEKSAVDFITFKTKLLLSETAGDPIKKAGLIRDIVDTIAKVPDAIGRAAYLRQTSTLMEMSETVLLTELNKILRGKVAKQQGSQGTQSSPSSQGYQGAQGFDPGPPELGPDGEEIILNDFEKQAQEDEIIHDELNTSNQEEELIRILLNYADFDFVIPGTEPEHPSAPIPTVKVKNFIIGEISEDGIHFSNELYAGILAEFSTLVEQQQQYEAQSFVQGLEETLKATAISLLTTRYELANWEEKGIVVKTDKDHLDKTVIDAIVYIKKKQLDKFLYELQREIKERVVENIEVDDLLEKYNRFLQIKIELNKMTNTVIQK